MQLDDLIKQVRLNIATGKFAEAKELLLANPDEMSRPEGAALGARIIGYVDGFEKAQAMFFDLESVWPDNFQLFKTHCSFLQDTGHYNESVTLCTEILEKFAHIPEAYELQINNYELLNQLSNGILLCDKASKLFPEYKAFAVRKEELLSLYNSEEEIDEAIEEIRNELNVKVIEETDENIRLILQRFKGRTGVHAVQTKMGKGWGYIPERRDLTRQDISAHLSGQKTLGIYVTDINNTSSLMVFDLDIRKAYLKQYAQCPEERRRINSFIRESSKRLLELCRGLGLTPLVECSGNKGMHFWFFASEPILCRYWRVLGNWIINKVNYMPEELSWEIFPKQDKVPIDGLGNLVKLPLGIHQKTGKQSLFVESETFEPLDDQIKALKEATVITKKDFENILGTITIDNCRTDGFVREASHSGGNVLAAVQALPSQCNKAVEDFKIEVKIPLPERNTVMVEQVLSGCKPMWLIMEKAKTQGHLEQKEKHAFVYIFTHLGDEGKVFVHQVLNQLPDYQPDSVNAMIRAVPPNPSGCARIRKHIPEYCINGNCSCQFRLPEGSYASPVVHAGIFPNTGNIVPRAELVQPARLSRQESYGGESGGIDKLMQEYVELTEQIEGLGRRRGLLQRQINKIFADEGKDVIETKIRKYHKLPEDEG